MHAVNPDLAKFKARGGKLLMYHGWSDGGSGGSISALNTVSYYESVLKHMGPDQDAWFRLFMVPGIDHCGGATGPPPLINTTQPHPSPHPPDPPPPPPHAI